jgi:hypothetical protein
MGGAAVGTGQGVLEADPHVVSPLEPSLDHLPGGRPSCVVKPRGIYPGPVEGRIHLLGQGRTPAPVLLLVDLHQDPEAPVGEAEAQESLDIGGIEESRLDPDPPAEQRLRELRNPVLGEVHRGEVGERVPSLHQPHPAFDVGLDPRGGGDPDGEARAGPPDRLQGQPNGVGLQGLGAVRGPRVDVNGTGPGHPGVMGLQSQLGG